MFSAIQAEPTLLKHEEEATANAELSRFWTSNFCNVQRLICEPHLKTKHTHLYYQFADSLTDNKRRLYGRIQSC
jgi:hypothetical protein